MISVKSVDASDPKVAALLTWLQLSTLTGDVPYEVEEGHWWIAYDGAMPVGFAGIVQSVRWCDTGYLCRSGVLRSHRGKGLQKRLIRVREAKAKRMGWRWLISDTYRNPPSANSLISCGFKTFIPSRPWGFENATYWRKRLT